MQKIFYDAFILTEIKIYNYFKQLIMFEKDNIALKNRNLKLSKIK